MYGEDIVSLSECEMQYNNFKSGLDVSKRRVEFEESNAPKRFKKVPNLTQKELVHNIINRETVRRHVEKIKEEEKKRIQVNTATAISDNNGYGQ
ncbi:hypothetical protein X777_07993 [Ooceraea biroi]|uniref:Uncharacterized protein n=1 Tax=Ooceraea biroi TaxID=2015173 RepID=A0A026WBT4_OOCBI|nr:hypothetical protein X777_07993 [Ooceraea biroi]